MSARAVKRCPRCKQVKPAGEFYRRQGAWKFRAVGQGYGSGLEGLATDYGITVDEPQQAPPAPVTTPPVVTTRSSTRPRGNGPRCLTFLPVIR